MSDIQSVVFFENKGWNNQLAKLWLQFHKFHPIKPVDTHLNNELRYRLTDPTKYSRFISKKLPVGINLIIGFKKKK